MKHTVYSLIAMIEGRMTSALEINAAKACTDPITLVLQFSEILLLLGRSRMTDSLSTQIKRELANTPITQTTSSNAFTLTMSATKPRTVFNSLDSLGEYK